MIKSTLFDASGNKKGNIELPELFSTKIREDLALKSFEAEKVIQPYASKHGAGMRHVASGIISHKRHDWKNQYGRGISRVPRKILWRRGTQFNWVGATTSGTRGGRKAHPPKGIGTEKKINKKESQLALNSGLAATTRESYFLQRYKTAKPMSLPLVVESLPAKTKSLSALLKNILGENFPLAFRDKKVRAGKGKMRSRKYKSNAGILIVTSVKDKKTFKGVEVKSSRELIMKDLYPLGRLTLFTQEAIKEMETKK